jgi:hypothetical protein
MTALRYTLFIALLACMACKSKKQPRVELLPEDMLQLQYDADYIVDDSSGLQNLVLHLDEDGTYSHFAANFYNYGTWKFIDSSKGLILKPESGYPLTEERYVFELEKLVAGRKLELYPMYKEGQQWVRGGQQTVMGCNNKSSAKPFVATNHVWRKKPNAPETPEQLKTRVRQYLSFLKDYFQYCQDNELEAMTYGWFPAPLQMHYNNGVRMAYSTELNDWYNCFYNQQQGIEGYKLIGGAMQKSKLQHHNSRAERNMDMVKQLLQNL